LAGVDFTQASHRELKRLHSSIYVLTESATLASFSASLAQAVERAADLVIVRDPFHKLAGPAAAEGLAQLRAAIAESQLAWLLLTSDMVVAREVADKAAVLLGSDIIESGTADQVIAHAQHPYTQALVSAFPQLDPIAHAEREFVVLETQTSMPSQGCSLVGRCPFSHLQCEQLVPELLADDEQHSVACFYPQERKVIVTNTRRPHSLRPMPQGSLGGTAYKPDYDGPVTGRDFVSD
jgi:oligopeptide/dipeptide ABC transporter ATP-binding protein